MYIHRVHSAYKLNIKQKRQMSAKFCLKKEKGRFSLTYNLKVFQIFIYKHHYNLLNINLYLLINLEMCLYIKKFLFISTRY